MSARSKADLSRARKLEAATDLAARARAVAVLAALALPCNAGRPGTCTSHTDGLHSQRCTTLRTAPLASPSLAAQPVPERCTAL